MIYSIMLQIHLLHTAHTQHSSPLILKENEKMYLIIVRVLFLKNISLPFSAKLQDFKICSQFPIIGGGVDDRGHIQCIACNKRNENIFGLGVGISIVL